MWLISIQDFAYPQEKEQTQTANKNGSDDASKNITVNNNDSNDPISGSRSPTKKDKEVNRVKDKSSKKELLTEKVSRSDEKGISSSKSVPVHNLSDDDNDLPDVINQPMPVKGTESYKKESKSHENECKSSKKEIESKKESKSHEKESKSHKKESEHKKQSKCHDKKSKSHGKDGEYEKESKSHERESKSHKKDSESNKEENKSQIENNVNNTSSKETPKKRKLSAESKKDSSSKSKSRKLSKLQHSTMEVDLTPRDKKESSPDLFDSSVGEI